MTQTVVEFLEERFERHLDWEEGERGAKLYTLEDFAKEFEIAKEMHKQEIIDAFTKGADDGFNGLSYENRKQYYNDTYRVAKEYPHSHIYETMNGKYGLSSYDEHDQTDGIFDTYQEAVDFGLSLIKKSTSSQTEISDEDISQAFKNYSENWEIRQALEEGAKWYREKLKTKI